MSARQKIAVEIAEKSLNSEFALFQNRAMAPLRLSSGVVSTAFFSIEAISLMLAMIATQFIYNIYVLGIGFDLKQAATLGALTLIPYMLLMMARAGYDPRGYRVTGRYILESMRNWIITFFILGWLGFMLKISANYSRGVISTYFILGGSSLILVRLIFLSVVGKLFNGGKLVLARAIIISDRSEEGMLDMRATLLDGGIEPVAYVNVGHLAANGKSSKKQLAAIIDQIKAIDIGKHIDSVHMFLPLEKTGLISAIYRRSKEIPFPIQLFSKNAFGEVIRDPLVRFDDYVGFQVQARALGLWQRLLKRTIDFVGALFGLLLLSPLMIMVSVAILVESGGPVLFLQKRRGQNGRPFTIFKFRSMSVSENGSQVTQAQKGDVRITGLGVMLRRTSIDELPQLFNVLLGQMSLVGPRPHAVAHDHYYGDRVLDYVARQHVLPGITGWAQVNGCRGETKDIADMQERIVHDVWYAQNWSLWLDLRIIFKTVQTVFSDKNAY